MGVRGGKVIPGENHYTKTIDLIYCTKILFLLSEICSYEGTHFSTYQQILVLTNFTNNFYGFTIYKHLFKKIFFNVYIFLRDRETEHE